MTEAELRAELAEWAAGEGLAGANMTVAAGSVLGLALILVAVVSNA